MELMNILKLLYVEGSAMKNVEIKVVHCQKTKQVFFEGKLKYFIEYISKNNDLKKEDGFTYNVKNISTWQVVEILADNSKEQESNFPIYNKSKIITIM